MLVIHNREEPPTGGKGWLFTHPVTGKVFQHYEYGAFIRQIIEHNRANGIEMPDLEEQICQQMNLSDRWCGEPPPAIETWDIKLSDLMRGGQLSEEVCVQWRGIGGSGGSESPGRDLFDLPEEDFLRELSSLFGILERAAGSDRQQTDSL